MKFASLGSGSGGNATLVSNGSVNMLIDCGFAVKDTIKRLARLGVEPEAITAILVTHEHSDHIRGVVPFARKFAIPVYATHGTLSAIDFDPDLNHTEICCHTRFSVDSIEVEPVAVPHDAREPCQYILRNGHHSLGILTDLGSITPFVLRCYRRLDALLLECNHDVALLEKGPYPQSVKRRIKSNYGHLSNEQAASFAAKIETANLQHLIVSHISQQNNTDALALGALCSAVGCAMDFVTVANQHEGFNWREIS